MEMTSPASPSPAPNLSLKRFLKLSLMVHGGLLLLLFMKSTFLPEKPELYLPSLRVDLVALPDQKKTDVIQPLPATPQPVEKPVPPTQVETKPEDKGDFTVSKKKKAPSKKEADAQKKLKEALARIKAIERIKAMTGTSVKGNQISKGSALSGEAKASLETTYFDVVLERVRSYWELPQWLQEQNLGAQVVVYLDGKGMMTRYRFTKTSGNEQFDNEVKRTLQAASPFPLPPSAIQSDLSGKGILLGFPI